ncbi:MAG TPA: septum formation initiator family protein, partial [Candidatus Aquicultoraceae bacterium]|nr:septum formation initiator family protein [Candidatus Aquicultoraceae bacterium]
FVIPSGNEENMDAASRSWARQRWPVLMIGGMVLAALLFSVFGEVGIVKTLSLREKHDQLLAENARLREENERLHQEVEKLRSNPSYIEEIARRELGLMGKKEIVIPTDRKTDAASLPAPRGEKSRP